MSEHLKTARHWMTEADKGRMQSGVPTLDDLGKAVWRIILHLESQAAQTAESPAQRATTGSRTTADPSAAGTSAEPLTPPEASEAWAMVSTVQAIQPLQQALMNLLQDRALTPAARYSTCMALLEASRSSWETPVPAVDGQTSTSQSPLSNSSADPSASDAAPSASSESSDAWNEAYDLGHEQGVQDGRTMAAIEQRFREARDAPPPAAPEPRYYVDGQHVHVRSKHGTHSYRVCYAESVIDAARICDLLNAAERGE